MFRYCYIKPSKHGAYKALRTTQQLRYNVKGTRGKIACNYGKNNPENFLVGVFFKGTQ